MIFVFVNLHCLFLRREYVGLTIIYFRKIISENVDFTIFCHSRQKFPLLEIVKYIQHKVGFIFILIIFIFKVSNSNSFTISIFISNSFTISIFISKSSSLTIFIGNSFISIVSIVILLKVNQCEKKDVADMETDENENENEGLGEEKCLGSPSISGSNTNSNKYHSFCTFSILLNKNTKPKYEHGQVGAAHRGGGFA